ncbi:hypothetical protein [Streptomyces sp. NPDC060243]|uniref:hypothetical protein n=1 Tax=Streptomyces sp. NPDC060243 TaxID=3347081 RepID=UPI00365DF828
MGLFSRKFNSMPTEEERYAARQQVPSTAPAPAPATTPRAERQAHPTAAPSPRMARLLSKVDKIGTVERRGNDIFIDGWVFAESSGATADQVAPGTRGSHVGSLSCKDLCDLYEYQTGRKAPLR